MILSTIGFLLLFYYLITSNSFTLNEINSIFYALIGIVFISIFWMPLSLEYMKNRQSIYKYLIIFVLLAVSYSTLYLLNVLNGVKDDSITKKLALGGMTYFFIHAFFFDSITWSLHFF